ncbi:MAG TPA: acetate--CoA ligase [bacterium]|nr:acetate--CoA ligase [bacterium]
MNRKYDELHQLSIADPSGFWGAEAEKLHWFKKWDKVLDDSNPPFYRWFVGGETNLCYNAVDRHALGAGRNKAAIIWESPETGQSRIITFFELYRQVNRLANVLLSKGINKGDRIIIYMPMVPEALVAVLACARIGAIHSVVFGGFSSDSLANRVDDCQPKMIICADGSSRKGKPVLLKKIVDSALDLAENNVPHVLVYDRKIAPWQAKEGRDLDWQTEMDAAPNTVVEPARMKSTDPSYILYTSGTTGKPKGVLRDTGGYMVAVHSSMDQIYGCGPDDVYWSTSDIGWVVGHSYIIYGPLLAGIPTLVFEGTPDNPNPGIWWEVIEKYGVTVVFSAPTAMRILRKFPGEWITKHDISSLRHIFLAGEPLDESTYQWASDTLQKPIVDHYWQTESGWAILTNHMGIETLPIKAGSPTKGAMGWNPVVVDEKGQEVEAGKRGTLIIKPPLPPGALLTIWGDDERYVETYWQKGDNGSMVYLSGDYARRDEDGYFWMLGRSDEVINVAGHRMGTREVEEVLSEHPKVAEASAIGIKDELKGQAIAAFVVLKQGVEATEDVTKELVQSIREKIGAIATPKTLRVVAQLPKTRSGKVMRRVLRALCEENDLGDLSTLEDGASVEEVKAALEGMEHKG